MRSTPRVISYACRDIGYGIEEGCEIIGRWGERDWTGKREFRRLNGETLYLFDDEVLEDEPLMMVIR